MTNIETIREFYEERAAIMHFDGGLPKEKAEALARAEAETWSRSLGLEFQIEMAWQA